ncbi:MAG: sugar transferase, partial [Acidobacteria bacterium]|nr:sugar transferase [Acidobacteriota bacterium]
MKVVTIGRSVRKGVFARRPVLITNDKILDQETFQKELAVERKRTERSRKAFLLMLVDLGSELRQVCHGSTLQDALSALVRTMRETDVAGWYGSDSTLAVIFTELGAEQTADSVMNAIYLRVGSTLKNHLTLEQFNGISISFHMFPEHSEPKAPPGPRNPVLYPDLIAQQEVLKFFGITKRLMDILGSLVLLALSSPLFFLVALAIKMASKGPVFYRQQRVGQYGVPFAMLKFRSMRVNSDATTHKEYVRKFIAGVAEKCPGDTPDQSVYKLTRDPRITALGAFLRKTSLDELPQLINVLRGEMSLVGPRPPIDYEVERYELWHRRRLLEVKPGITGL